MRETKTSGEEDGGGWVGRDELTDDPLIGRKRQELVIVHHRVHRFNPISIQIPIENDPLGVGSWSVGAFTKQHRENEQLYSGS